MKKAMSFLLVWSLTVGLFAQQGDNNQQKALVFTHVTVIDATGAPAKIDMTVVIKGDRIAALGKTTNLDVPENAHVVDATGKFLIPGLWDMHIHPHEKDTKEYLALFIANGVTGMRVMWGFPKHHKWREEILAGELIGPRMFIAGTGIAGNEDETRQAVRKIKSDGADFIKVGVQDVPRDIYFAMADEANKLGIPFVGHMPFYVGLAEASDVGLHTLEHTVFVVFATSSESEEEIRKIGKKVTEPPVDLYAKYKFVVDIPYSEKKAAELFARLVKNGTWVCPTLLVRAKGGGPDDPRLKYVPVFVRDWHRNHYKKHMTNREIWDVRQKFFEKNSAIVGAMNDAGVGLLAGTDTYMPGLDLQDELVVLVQAGLSPMEALQTATYNAAKCMGLLDTVGTVEPGKVADLVLLDADPLQDIGNTRKIAAVVFGGKFFDKPALQKIFAQAEAREALHQAAVDGDIEQVKSLISEGADVNATSTIRWTPLQYAASEGHREIVELLLEHDADVHYHDNAHSVRTAAEFAMRNNHTEIVQLLISKGADISPLHFALYIKDEARVRSLIEGGADVHKRTPNGATTLRRAVDAGFKDIVELLIAKDAEVNAEVPWNWTPLHAAAERGQKEIVELLVAAGANVNAMDGDDKTPVFYAEHNGHTEIVEILRKHGAREFDIEDDRSLLEAATDGNIVEVRSLIVEGADVQSKDAFGWTPLHIAASQGSEEITSLLIENGCDVNAKDNAGETPLHLAAELGNRSLVDVLLTAGAEIDATNDEGATPLHLAMNQNHRDVAELLIARGAEVNAKMNRGQTLLHLAASTGNRDMVELVLANGADVNAKTSAGITPLHVAVRQAKKDVAELLLRNGADIEAKMIGRQTPLHFASWRGPKINAELLIAKGADVDAKDKHGKTPLHIASLLGRGDFMELLIAKGADIDARTKEGETPLHMAAMLDRSEVAKLLLEEGADLNATTVFGATALHATVENESTRTLEILLAEGADVNVKDMQDRTPLDVAVGEGFDELAELLRKNRSK